MSNNHLVSQNEVASWVARQMAGEESAEGLDELQIATNIMKLFAAMGKFVTFMFRKKHFATVVADIYGLGSFLRNCILCKTEDTFQRNAAIGPKTEPTQFIPNNML
jgi:hypothetical protein